MYKEQTEGEEGKYARKTRGERGGVKQPGVGCKDTWVGSKNTNRHTAQGQIRK